MKPILAVVIILFSVATKPVFAAPFNSSLHKDVCHCSNGNDYDVLRHFYTLSFPHVEIAAFCEAGTLQKPGSEYDFNWKNPAKPTDPEFAACVDKESEEIDFCLKEMKKLNVRKPFEGLVPLKHERAVALPSAQGSVNSEAGVR